jgi:AcrR family transcriptional regulator
MKSHDDVLLRRILEIASSFIFQTGVKGWNMDMLADKAGITKRTLYKIYPSKEAIVESVVLDSIRSIQNKLHSIIEAGTDFRSTLEKIMSEYPDIQKKFAINVYKAVYLEFPKIEDKVLTLREELTASLLKYLREGISTGILRKEAEPEIVLQILQAIVIYFIKSDSEGGYDKKLRIAFLLILRGILKN